MPSFTYCNTCGHLTPQEQTYCERCGASLLPAVKTFNPLPAVLGFVVGIVLFVLVGLLVNVIALNAGNHNASAVDFVIVLLLGAAVFGLIYTRRAGSGFYVALLVAMLGGFAVCGGIFASSHS